MQNTRLGIKISTATCNIFFQPHSHFEWHEPYVLNVCFGHMVWAYPLGLCFGGMRWAYHLGICFEPMLWAYALGVCFGCLLAAKIELLATSINNT